jgi:antitoxin StbD
MDTIQAPLSCSISELKRNPSSIIEAAQGRAIAVLNHNRPTAYIIPTHLYESLIALQEKQTRVTLAHFIQALPPATSYHADPVSVQKEMRNDW